MGTKRIETEDEIKAYVARMKYALNTNAKITFQINRKVDEERDIKYTNRYTIAELFPDDNPKDVLRRELLALSVKDYQYTVKDDRYPNRSEMRVFGKTYNDDDVYIKIRVELMSTADCGEHSVFVMSFHFSEIPFSKDDFPYRM